MIAVLGFSQILKAQQEQQYSQYILNPFTINPAVAGTEDFVDLQIGHRSQWVGFEGAPTTTYLLGHKTVGKSYRQYRSKADHKNWHGIGFQLYQDKTGPLKRNAFLLAYAYNMGLSNKTRLSVGSYVGIKQLRTDLNYWESINDQTDNLFSAALNTGVQPNLQLGISIYNPWYFINISGMNLLALQMDLEVPNDEKNENAIYQRHFFLNMGLRLEPGYNTRITSAILLKYAVESPASFDLSVKVDHNKNKFWYGASFRLIESFNVFAGINLLDHVDISYAYEYSISKIRKYNAGTHEIIMGLRIGHPKSVTCPQKFW